MFEFVAPEVATAGMVLLLVPERAAAGSAGRNDSRRAERVGEAESGAAS